MGVQRGQDEGRGEGADLSSRVLGSGMLIGRPFGIPVFISPSWLFIAALITYIFAPYVESSLPGIGSWKWVVSFGYAAFLLLSVLLHELSHSIVALRLGLKVRQITLWWLGGVSSLDEPDTARKDFLVAAAGPAASIAIGVVAYGLHTALPADGVPYFLAFQLAVVNALLAVFNLLPGLPLDGGGIVRAVVWKVLGSRSRGTVAAAWAGRVIALLVVLVVLWRSLGAGGTSGLVNVIWGGLIAAFLWGGATQALRVERLRSRLPRAHARNLLRPALTVPGDLPLGEAVRRAREAGKRALVVADSLDRPTGIVNESAVAATPEARWPWIAVSALMRSTEDSIMLAADLDGEQLIRTMQRKPAPEYLVVEPGTDTVVGVLATADVERAVANA